MICKATQLIAAAFDEHNFKYEIIETDDESSIVNAGFSITCGPNARILFASRNDGNDVSVQILGLMRNITQEKRAAMLEACNTLNGKVRFLKFYIHDDDLIGEYDIPSSVSDDCLAECCVEIFIRTLQILHTEYHYFPEAIYCDDPREKGSAAVELLNAINELQRNPVQVSEDRGGISDQSSKGNAEDMDLSAGHTDLNESNDSPHVIKKLAAFLQRWTKRE